MKLPLSVAIIAQDEEDRIDACVRSALFADEVVVVDGGSRDATPDIAESLGCRVIRNPWPGYAAQKQFAVDQCANDWVLILDADERIPEATRTGIERLLSQTDDGASLADGYALLRRNFLHGKWIRRCGWWPDRVLRLVNRQKGRFSNDRVHERWLCSGAVEPLELRIDHHSFRNYADLIDKMQRYSTLAAEEMAEKDRSASAWTAISHGAWSFFSVYLLRLGFLEGFDGLMISLLNAQGSFMKYAKRREVIVIRRGATGKP